MAGEKIYLMLQESNVDGEILINIVPCSTMEKAKEVLEEEKNTILNESYHFSGRTPEELKEDFYVDEEEDGTYWYINDESDDYYEELKIVEKEVL